MVLHNVLSAPLLLAIPPFVFQQVHEDIHLTFLHRVFVLRGLAPVGKTSKDVAIVRKQEAE